MVNHLIELILLMPFFLDAIGYLFFAMLSLLFSRCYSFFFRDAIFITIVAFVANFDNYVLKECLLCFLIFLYAEG